ncbi:hypothetical protein [Polaribacter sp. Asnod6-C07]|uniref:hypothetical protein n=1 Tax=Polaribacter sp. Asnod6-C07 TaxID=3160582 RepID=UPI003867C99C
MKFMGIHLFDFFRKYSWILGSLLLVYGLYIYLNDKTEFFSNKDDAYGIVYGVTSLRIVRYNGLLYKYKFRYKGKDFLGKTTKSYAGNFEKNIYYKVKFIPGNPKKNEISFENKYIQKIKLDNKGKVIDTIYFTVN